MTSQDGDARLRAALRQVADEIGAEAARSDGVTVSRAIRGGADSDDPGDAGGGGYHVEVAAPSRHRQLLRILQLAGRQRRLSHKTDLRSVSATTNFAGVYCRLVILLISCDKAVW
jgi:hypothetical protein